MLSLPPPPKPPAGTEELLHQLADYYQQLQEYHQRAAAAAAQQLAHLQCLLPSPRQAVLTTEVAREGQAALDKAASQPTLISNPEEEMPRMASWLEIEDTLEEGRGKMLHLGFIVRKLYGRLPPEILAPVTERTRQQLAEGARAGKWFAVPDSPDCWTIDLREFPDWAEPEAEEEAGQEAAIPASALPTKQASRRLGISHYRLNDDRLKYGEQLHEGVHYFRNSQRRIYWTEEGMARVRQLREADPLTREGKKKLARYKLRSKKAPMMAPYQSLSPHEAVKKLLQANRGRILSTEEIVTLLYGELEEAALKKHKEDMSKILSAGKMKGEWQRVPGKVGCYTANLQDLSAAERQDSQLGLFPEPG